MDNSVNDSVNDFVDDSIDRKNMLSTYNAVQVRSVVMFIISRLSVHTPFSA